LFTALLLLLAGFAVAGARPAAKPRLTLLVPAYFYPGGKGAAEWDRLLAAADEAPIVAIVNPASGPGKRRDPNYTAVLKRAKAAGVRTIGYVSTRYAKRPLADVFGDVDAWARFYPDVEGIFFDEQPSDFKFVDHYGRLSAYVRTKIRGALIIANPGTLCDELYVKRSAADVETLFENGRGFDAFKMPAWTRAYSRRRFAALPYAVKTAEQMTAFVRLAQERRLGYLYVTDDGGRNPWDRLPTYWDKLVKQVHAANAAG